MRVPPSGGASPSGIAWPVSTPRCDERGWRVSRWRVSGWRVEARGCGARPGDAPAEAWRQACRRTPRPTSRSSSTRAPA
eukprot:scaffold198762_cov28-Tisochrysis_lutea.AAC.2